MSDFPTSVDDRIYFSDANIDDASDIATYQNMLAHGDYINASQYLVTSGVPYFGAWFLNLIEDRIVAIENYLPEKIKPTIQVYQDSAPDNPTEWLNWVGTQEAGYDYIYSNYFFTNTEPVGVTPDDIWITDDLDIYVSKDNLSFYYQATEPVNAPNGSIWVTNGGV